MPQSGSLFEEEKPEPIKPAAPAAVPFTWSEQWRHECEVRYVKAMTYSRREDHLRNVAKKRGAEAGAALRRDVERP